jgi:hypothetical protein
MAPSNFLTTAHLGFRWPIFPLKKWAHVGWVGLRPYRLQEQIYELGMPRPGGC